MKVTMKNDLTLEAARKAKDTCEGAVIAAIRAFEEDTGLHVFNLNFSLDDVVVGRRVPQVALSARSASGTTVQFGNGHYPF
jgi:hypothetical protein